MPLKRSIVRALSLHKSDPNSDERSRKGSIFSLHKGDRKSDEKLRKGSVLTTPYFQAAPNKAFDIKKTWLTSGRQPEGHSVLQPHQISTIIFLLSLPRDTPLLATRIAALGPPLARPSFTNPPHGFCKTHIWFEGRWIEDLTDVVGEEIGPRLGRLRTCPADLLSTETKELLMTVEPYLHLFPISGTGAGSASHASECHRATCRICSLANCPACKLSLFLQNSDAVRAIKICAVGRKKKNEPWPEACAWLDPEPGVDWEARWRHEGKGILRDRAHVQYYFRDTMRSAEARTSMETEYSGASADAKSVRAEKWFQEEKTWSEEVSMRVYMDDWQAAHEEKTWEENLPIEEHTKDVKSQFAGSAQHSFFLGSPVDVEKVKSYFPGTTQDSYDPEKSIANMEDATSRCSRPTRGTGVLKSSFADLGDTNIQRLRSARDMCMMKEACSYTEANSTVKKPEEASVRRLKSVRGTSIRKESSAYVKVDLTNKKPIKSREYTRLSMMMNSMESGEDETAIVGEDEEDPEKKEAAWAESYEKLIGNWPQAEGYNQKS